MGRRAAPRRISLRRAALAVTAAAAAVAGRWSVSSADWGSSLGSTLFVSARRSPGLLPSAQRTGATTSTRALEAPPAAQTTEQAPAEPPRRQAPSNVFFQTPAEPPRRRLPATPKVYMVCYETREEAERAVQLMGGTYIDGKPIQVTYDDFEECLEDGHFKVNVQGVSPYTDDAEVEAHMGKVGTVTSFKTEMDWKFGEVRFEDAEDAWQARVQLDGTTFMGRRIRAELDCSTESLSTVLVHGIQRRASWHDLKDHFKLFGPIDWTAIHGGPRTARVEFATTEGAQRAVRELNKMQVKGQRMRIYVAYAHDGTGAKMKDNGELEFIPTIVRVQNVEKWTTEEQLHELFSEVGEVLTVTKMDADSLVPPEFLIT